MRSFLLKPFIIISKTFIYFSKIYLMFMFHFNLVRMVGLNGLEPSTSRLSSVRSNQLSYRPINYKACFKPLKTEYCSINLIIISNFTP